MEIWPSYFVGINTKSTLRDEGYAWVPKTQDFTENSGKNSKKIQIFSFSQIHGVLTVRIFVPRVKVTLRDESYAWVPKSRDLARFPREIVNMY